MSILAVDSLHFPELFASLLLVLGTAFSLAFIVIARQRLPRLRPPPSDSVSTLFFILVGALGFLVVGTAFGASLMKHLQPEEFRTQAAGLVGMVAASCGAILMDSLYRNDGLNRLGLAPKKLPRGMAAGVLWLILILPWVYWVTVATEAVIVHFHIQSPTMHEIFRVWDSPEGKSTGFRIVAIIAACVVAPFSEELLFRGLLQTLIVRLLARKDAVVSDFGRSFLAIIITAALFASIHRPWTIQPAIFVLAIGLGLAYEYLGNLWATITIHCLFNAANFIIFLKTH
jgi:membrane protease YdiL (CAAX protease family)